MDTQRASLASLVDDFTRLGANTAVVQQIGLRITRTSYRELADLAKRFASELIERGIGKGDRVILHGNNGAEWMAVFFGCVLRGVLPVPLDEGSAADFCRRVEADVRPKLCVSDASLFSTDTVTLTGLADKISHTQCQPLPDLCRDDALQIIFTSGTTGDPKGVVHTHGNVLASLTPIETEIRRYKKYLPLVHPIRFLHTLPLSHVFGQFMGLWLPALIGAEVHYNQRPVASHLPEYIKRERISVLCTVPRVLSLLRSATEPGIQQRLSLAPVSAWKRWWLYRDVHARFGFKFWAVICGGASLPATDEQFWRTLGFVVIQGYGMTETTALISLNHPFKTAQGTVGKVLPGREVQIADDGEVLVRGETISKQEWRAGEARELSSEWLHTGDLGAIDSGGNLHFHGRKKDVIVTAAGMNVHPEDLEAALKRQHDVSDCAVVANNAGAIVAALLMRRSGDPGATVQQANAELASWQQIQHAVVWPYPDLPRTSTGKVLRREVQRQLTGLAPVASQPSEELDSLARVEQQAEFAQQYGLELTDAPLGSAPRVAKNRYHRWPWKWPVRIARALFMQLVAMPLVRFLAAPVIESRVPRLPTAPMLIVCNHITTYDVPLILAALPRAMRASTAPAMSGELMQEVGWLPRFLITALFNAFPLPQKSDFRPSFAHAGAAVDHGFSVIVFPEGTRSPDGTPAPFMRGAGLLWKDLGIPALAVRLDGLGEIKARGGRWFRTGQIRVNISALLPLDRNKTAEQLTAELEHAVFSM